MAKDWTATPRAMLLSRTRPVMIGVGLLAAGLVLGTWLVDEGEIVKLTSVDAAGREQVTELWIVDMPSGAWLRAGDPASRWLARIRANPEVVLERDGELQHYRALPDSSPETREEINRAMAEKYGAADRFWGRISDHGKTVPVRLRPLPEPVPESGAGGGARKGPP
jgi:hypothetical protein